MQKNVWNVEKKSLNRKKGYHVNNTTWNLARAQQKAFAYLAPLQV